MHIVNQNNLFVKPNTKHRQSKYNATSRIPLDQDPPQMVEDKRKTAHGHTMADVEKQILDWQDEMRAERDQRNRLIHPADAENR